MKSIIAIEHKKADYERVSAALKMLCATVERYDCITKSDSGTKVRLVKGDMLFDVKKAEAINKCLNTYYDDL